MNSGAVERQRVGGKRVDGQRLNGQRLEGQRMEQQRVKGQRLNGQRAVALYVACLLGLAAIGGANRVAIYQQVDLMDEKQELIARVVDLRADAARVEGPHAVTTWAEAHGMIPAPENERIENVAPLAAPVIRDAEGGLEVRTVWQ